MIRAKASRISIDDAARCVGRAMFADEWIDTITARETWLIERYVEGRVRHEGAVLPRKTTWEIGGRRWSEYPSDPALVAEVEQARDKRDWSEDQWERAFVWLEENGFHLDADEIDQDAFEAAMFRLRAQPQPDEAKTIDVPHDTLVAFFRERYGAPRETPNREVMNHAAEQHFGGHIRVKVLAAARRAAGVTGKVGRPRKLGK
jgi:hypothetical protein